MPFFSVMFGFYRTNNHAEGENSKMRPKFAGARNNIFTFLDVVKTEALSLRRLIQRLNAGEPAPLPNPTIRARNQRILTVFEQYDTFDRLDFLRGIGYNVRLGNEGQERQDGNEDDQQ